MNYGKYWKEQTCGQDLLEQISDDFAEITDRFKNELENCVMRHLDDVYEIGFDDGQEAQDDE
ncbi:MAG: hypothetical protein J5504_11645 [Butyrivibrio sp.]|nr:hypothetical protein [Butyrivibrio sp.]